MRLFRRPELRTHYRGVHPIVRIVWLSYKRVKELAVYYHHIRNHRVLAGQP